VRLTDESIKGSYGVLVEYKDINVERTVKEGSKEKPRKREVREKERRTGEGGRGWTRVGEGRGQGGGHEG
jgi:hypothetical protein